MLNTIDKITIWQQNVNKSPSCQHDLLGNNQLIRSGISVVALQEPAVNFTNRSIASKDWYPVYPSTHTLSPDKTRSLLLINATINLDSWEQINIPSGDITAVVIRGTESDLLLYNVYNDGENNTSLNTLTSAHNTVSAIPSAKLRHIIWLGDFNRHHPVWDNVNDTRLFTDEALTSAERLIEAIADAGLELALPAGIPTHLHNVTKQWTRLDHVFISEYSLGSVISCNTLPESRGIKTDHLPIVTELDLEIPVADDSSSYKFRDVDWEAFQKTLSTQLRDAPRIANITNQRLLDESCRDLTTAIQRTIRSDVPTIEICSKSKRWWTKELTMLRKRANKLGRLSYKHKDNPAHPVHAEHKAAVRTYSNTLKSTKKHHWRDWLERAEDPDIWTVHRLITSPASDGGKSRIPGLKYKDSADGDEKLAASNTEKSKVLAKCFFPTKPPALPPQTPNPDQQDADIEALNITREQILRQLRRLKPYKAPGPDGIPNVVLTKCADIIVDRLFGIYNAMLELDLQYEPWKHFTTVVLRKPGKPRYDLPKAYRPIALLNTMAKVATAIVADHISHLTEKHQLLPAHHFGGRPGRTTTDAVHLLTCKIKDAWRSGKVAAVLFLDIEGAFPNAVPERLTSNLSKRGIPSKYVKFTENMLMNRTTKLKFDGYESEDHSINNGIGQGDPLSMILYQFYNADLMEIPEGKDESSMAYVDDALLIAIAKTFEEAHEILADMMTRRGGVIDWSKSHNSPLEYSKLALVNFAHPASTKERTPLTLPSGEINPAPSTKYLGVMLDQHLNWKAQHAYAIEKGTKWAAQIRRIARPTWGITPKYARRLYISVALPKIMYGADLWCHPMQGERSERKFKGSARVLKQLATLQRAGSIAITGGLRTSPTETLNAMSFLLPIPQLVDKACFRALTRLATLPLEHPLHPLIRKNAAGRTKRHRAPLHTLLSLYNLNTSTVEKIPPTMRNPEQTGRLPFTLSIPENRTSAVTEAAAATEEIQIFSDGSAIDGKVGAAAILMLRGAIINTLHYHLGPASEHTVHEAELVGLILGLHLIRAIRIGDKRMAIGIDNQAVLKAFHSDLRSPGHHLAREALRLANIIQKRRGRTKHKLILRWVAGHEGIEGNEIADSEAKKAANGMSSSKPALPVYLRKTLPLNPAALRQHHNEKLTRTWTSELKDTKRGKAFLRIDKTSPSPSFLKRISNPRLSRKSASLIAQLAISHVPLNAYLHKFKLVDKPQCPACGADKEDAEHFLLKCPAYAHERWALLQSAKKKKQLLTMESLFGDRDLTIPLANFIEATYRFNQQTLHPRNTP